MTQDLLTDAVSALDDDILNNYEADRAANAALRKRRRMRRCALAASFLLVVAAGLWLFLPLGAATEEGLIIVLLDPPDDKDYVVQYRREGDSYAYRAESAILALRQGELYMENEAERYYRVKGADDLATLIGERKDTGKRYVYTFSHFTPYMADEETARSMPALGEIWSMIYGVEDASDIRRVTLEPMHVSCPHDRDLPIPTVTLTEAADLARFYAIMAPLDYQGELLHHNPVECASPEYLEGNTPLTVQTCRDVTVEFKSGEVFRLDFFAPEGAVRAWNHADYATLSDADRAWLIGKAEIDLAYRDWGTVKEDPAPTPPSANGTVVTPPSTYETEKPVDAGHSD